MKLPEAEGEDHPAKRQRREPADPPADHLPFHDGLFDEERVAELAAQHAASQPYHHAVVNGLFDPTFLHSARKELTEQVSFREKETDIYKISQTGDLTNLSGLPASELALLPTLLQLRDAIYSAKFRSFIQRVTGCGHLSGSKTDMSCAEYGEGSYLLNHDDVIGTRRISFILYLVLDEPRWEKEWGGALELYPVLPKDSDNPDRPNVPAAKPSLSIPPAFNQFAFFVVQPGHSFHSVEEVVVSGDGKRGGIGSRLSLSGWFHKPVLGEEGYEGEDAFAPKSSLQQLYATTLAPPTSYTNDIDLPLPLVPSPKDLSELALVNPAYLNGKTLKHLRNQFVETSQLVLADFLRVDVAAELESLVREVDAATEKGRRGAKVGGRETALIPSMEEGERDGWTIVGPPHIQRFLSLSETAPSSPRLTELLLSIHTLFTSDAFRALLASLTSLVPLSHTTHARRFRPGLDYTLARGEPSDGDARLDVGLCLTPVPGSAADQALWEEGDIGGWELWLATEEGGDEATYGADEDDEPLLALEPGWNRLTLVLRDAGVLKFVKYLSARAPASRWDVSGEWAIGIVEDDGE